MSEEHKTLNNRVSITMVKIVKLIDWQGKPLVLIPYSVLTSPEGLYGTCPA